MLFNALICTIIKMLLELNKISYDRSEQFIKYLTP